MGHQKLIARPGSAHPLGATVDRKGVNFSLFSRHATGVELLLFEAHDSPQPYASYVLDPFKNNTFFFWNIYIEGLRPGAFYAYRVDGPNDPAKGHRFNRNKVLLDPYAKAVSDTLWDRAAACTWDDNVATSMRGIVVDTSRYDWEGDRPLTLPTEELIIYETHVKGFTASPTSKAKYRGTFRGLTEKIGYLKSLGITAVELLPVFQFDSKEDLPNYWGYSTTAFFAPKNAYGTSAIDSRHVNEFRDMVKALHRAGIAVILDVVFNHTGEGDEHGPTSSFRGIDNAIYYLLSPQDRHCYMNFSGCGNTVNCNHPIVAKFIVDCLEYWRDEMHVDGFRFDEGSILSRDENGQPMRHPPVIWSIELSERLAKAKMITEAWDAGGLYQIGNFPGYRYMEFNGRFRDDVRRFVRGDGSIKMLAQRLGGSADMYEAGGHLPTNSLNFVTCHDGFTMADLVSYNGKHNEANGLNNTDGIDDNVSSNYGVEGPAAELDGLRRRQVRNFWTLLMLSRGVPFLLMGDEMLRTQQGNNNTFCQDSELAWMDWNLADANADMVDFVRGLIAFRKAYPMLAKSQFYTGGLTESGLPDIAFHGCQLGLPGWDTPGAKALAFTVAGGKREGVLHAMVNMDVNDLRFEVPALPGRTWQRKIDTSRSGFEGAVMPPRRGQAVLEREITVPGRSIIVLVAR